jgi:hypothetical protein
MEVAQKWGLRSWAFLGSIDGEGHERVLGWDEVCWRR